MIKNRIIGNCNSRVLICLAIIAGILAHIPCFLNVVRLCVSSRLVSLVRELKQFIRGGRAPEENCFNITTLESEITTEDTEKTTKYI